LKPGDFERRVKALAEDSDNIILGAHAKERCEERGFTRLDVERTLRCGFVKGIVELTDQKEWKGKLVKEKGGRDMGVVTVVLLRGKLFVKTVEWEYPK
jgi:hypothetical protein